MRSQSLALVMLCLAACTVPRTVVQEGRADGQVTGSRRAADTGFVTVPGGRLFYVTEGAGEPIVLIHGHVGDHRHWDAQVGALARHYQVVRYDVRGFGKSSIPAAEAPYSHREDLLALLDHLGIRTAHLICWSMGSGIAIDFALDNPRRAASLVSVGPWVNGHASPAVEKLLNDFRQVGSAMAQGGQSAAVDAWMSAPFFRSTIRDGAAGARFREIARDYSFWHFSHRDPGRSLTPAAARRTAEISVPTLVVTAEGDIPACLEIADLLVGSVPRARKVVMTGTGHLMQMERPSEFNQTILSFVGAVAAAR